MKDDGPISVTDEGRVISVNDVQLLNDDWRIFVNDDGSSNVICFNLLPNAFSPIISTDEGIVICFNKSHELKAFPPIIVTDEGIAICFNDMHPKKAKFPISFTDEGIVTCDKEMHLQKQQFWMITMDDGMFISFNNEQP